MDNIEHLLEQSMIFKITAENQEKIEKEGTWFLQRKCMSDIIVLCDADEELKRGCGTLFMNHVVRHHREYRLVGEEITVDNAYDKYKESFFAYKFIASLPDQRAYLVRKIKEGDVKYVVRSHVTVGEIKAYRYLMWVNHLHMLKFFIECYGIPKWHVLMPINKVIERAVSRNDQPMIEYLRTLYSLTDQEIKDLS